jgi:hypothetical protein
MNRIYKLVFNASLGIVQVVSELVGRHGSRLSAGARRRLPVPSALAAAVAAACVRSGSGMAGARMAMLGLALVAGGAWADASGTYPVLDGDGNYQDTSLVLTSEVAGQTDDDGDVIDGKRIGVIATDGTSDYLVRDIAGIGQTLLVAGDGSSGVSGSDAPTQVQSVTVVGYYLYAGGGVSQTLSTDVSYDATAGQWVDGSGQAVQIARIAYGSTGTDEDGNPTVSVAGAVDVAVKLPADDDGDDGSDGGYAAGSRVSIDRAGAKGKNGRTGALFVPAKAGSDGGRGPDIVANAATNAGLNVQEISTIAPGHAGIFVSSTGGKGGDGGDIWLSASKAKPGGNGGSGGNVTVTVSGHGTIVTSADGNTPAPGIAVQSKSGQGGEGGSSYAGGGAAGGGGTKTAGNVSLTTSANVETSGDNSAALLVQSLGGGGGKGGDSFDLFPTSGASGGAGGDAGAVVVDNSGNLTTHGNDSAGINAQSIGGTGGNGGTTVAIVVLGSDSTSIGGNGGTVDVTNSGVIKTAGDGSDGISAQSIGGGGGRTGTAVGIVTLGGSSAAGGNAGAVAVHNSGTIITGGEAANGILAQSIGGGGGKGGTHVGAVALGSAGGAGGNAGQVAVDNTATIVTGGDHSAAILAQSIGGGGGAGGATGGLVALGAAGAAGGNAAVVRVENSGALQTSGVQADGIVAQSIGGGGGSGSSAGGLVALGGSGGKGGTADAVAVVNSGDITIQGEGGAAIVAQSIGGGGGRGGSAGGLVSLAGKGGSGGDAGCTTATLCSSIGGSADERDDGRAVSVENSGSLRTAGDYGYGILAQSIGGGGGDGGNAGAAFLSIGGSGGKGGAGGDVAIANVGDIITSGAHADGILAQSIGGGGGNGGLAVSAAPFVAVALGGSGGEGGDGGNVSATLGQGPALPTIITGGDNAAGIKLESVGGGGGNGGTAAAASIGLGVPLSVSFSQGGSGGDGGDGGLVTVQGNARIATSGDNADALYLSTIGGGGGSGGNAVGVSLAASLGGYSLNFNSSKGGSGGDGGRGGDIEMDTGDDADGVLQTSGDFSTGLLAQTIGGGGGSGGDTIAVTGTVGSAYSLAYTAALGGTAGKGGAGGDIELTYNGAIATGIEAGQAGGSDGFGSTGALIQSIGGGGGSGGSVISAQAGLSLAGLNVNQTLGGSGGDGGRGGTIDAHLGGSIQTGGDNAGGAVIQSVGGGGGNSGNKIQASLQAGLASGSLSLGIGGTSAGAGNDGGAVSATVAADVATQGNQSDAVLIQSVGGGGGNGGYTIDAGASVGVAAAVSGTLSMGASGGNGGDGGTVDAAIVGNLSTLGDQSRGAVVQSVGGGGGNGGFDIAAQLNISANPFAGVSAGVTMGIGGSAGNGGDGGDVSASLTGASVTQGQQSDAYVVQSLGGGGGNGGFAVAGGLAVSVGVAATGALQAAIGIGGSGGSGGDAGNATGTLAGDIGTSGDQSTGMLVQSVGGGGGNGGFTVGGSLSIAQGMAGNASIGIGGVGGSGGVAGQASGHLADGDVVTEGDDSAGVVVQSIGGGGGNGGFNVAGGASLAGEGAAGASVGIGGTGGSGGTAALASASLERVHVQTAGGNATGVLVQSVGGGGGNGGFNIAGSVSAASTGAAAVAVGIGGNGGSGGVAGDAAATLDDGWVHTYGGNAAGVVVQSVGGGGGNGGFNVGAGVAVSQVAGTVGVGIGGTGGTGGRGGSADAVVRTDVLTEGDDATGVLVQSVGGGGGNGGFNIAGGAAVASTGAVGVSVGLGGTGGDGGSAGAVSLDKQGLTYTRGDGSAALVAQSIGGGGGNGGFNVSGTLAASAGVGGSVAVGIGGNGGSGASAGSVVLTQQGQVQTEGADAVGILAQSVGGGGGNGGFNVSGGISAGAEGGAAVAVGLGGSGGDGGSAGSVILDSTGAVVTSGAGSTGIVAQSVGGGGGNGAFNVSGGVQVSGGESLSVSVGLGGRGGSGGSGGDVHASAVAAVPDGSGNDGLAVATLGDGATGLVAQSIGGGGGNGGFNVTGALTASGGAGGSVSVGLGGDGGDGGSAGDVDGFTSGLVSTDGDGSDGVVLQSIGGGGGNGGFNVAGAATVTGSSGGSVSVGLGGNGGTGGTSGNVTGSINATDLRDGYAVMTQGDGASAVVAQSLAGGGGNGGFNVAGALSVAGSNGASIGVGIGGRGGQGNDAGDVDVDVVGNIQTQGDAALGVLQQSVGGGGGNGGFNVAGTLSATGSNGGAVAVGVGGSGGDGGNAGNVGGSVTGNVLTAGDDAGAITYQSIGGGGGNGGFDVSGGLSASAGRSASVSVGLGGNGGSGGEGGDVTGAVSGDVATLGQRADAITYQSIGGGGGNGGFNVTGGLSASVGDGGAISVGLGGTGGDGGSAGDVDGSTSGLVFTQGEDSDGVVLQSIGGGGGNGGFNVAGTMAVTGGDGGSISVGLGGNGGSGGVSGAVTGHIQAGSGHDGYAVVTQGQSANAVVAQSLAGGGGNGGFNVAGALTVSNGNSASIGVGIGGRGGTGNDAGDVDVDVDGNIQTGGDGAQGIVLQSIGGGGGNGGFNVAGALNVAQSNGGSIAVGVGGSGGDGGDGGNVSGTLVGNVATAGDDAGAVTYQSIGGGGGNGGMTISGSLAASGDGSGNVTASIGVGGSGGSGGRGGAVSATLEGDLLTEGENAYGGLFQSIGGGGGNGGMTISGGLTVSAEAENQLAVSVGVGGSGGSGGLTVSGAGGLNLGEGSRNLAVAVGIGGNGGSGGSAGDVTGVLQGDYLTLGDGSTAVLAQSLGGGGGNGGITITGGIAASLGDNGAASIGIGGTGGSGNTAGDVQLSLAGNVVTQGANADAIVAQSIGGGGGNGGLNVAGTLALGDSKNGTVAVGIGGKGGEGAVAGDVDVQVSGTVAATGGHGADITLGDGGNFKVAATDLANGSNGIVAQSIGGGGGNGGINIQGGLSVDPTSVFGSDDAEDTAGTGGSGAGSQASSGGSGGSDESTSVGIVFGIGGNGGTGGDAGDVGVAVAGQDDYVLAVGDEKSAILAQSIGGGGGNGGINIGAAISTGSSITVGLGGNGANGGAGGDVVVDAATDVFAYGDHARGILAQSIGGGGGAGGINISATLSKPSSDDSVSLVVGLGGAGGTGNTAGAVDVSQRGNVNVVGSFASAILAQSIGGGGGAGGQNISASAAKGEQMLAVSAGVGGDGAEGGDAGAVSVASDGNLYVNANGETAGEGGTGILAQSIGGGGGAGGGTVSGLYSSATVPITLGVGGNGGSGGNAGTVSVTRGNAADWGTDVVPASSLYIGGDNATGILAQSIGGGGGNGGGTLVLEKYASANASGGDGATAEAGSGTGTGTGTGAGTGSGSGSGDEDTSVAASLQIGGSGAGAGSGAAVDVTNVGNVYTSGAHSSAIVAQSIGGGGGNAGQNVRKASGMDDVDVGLSISLGGATGAAGTGGDVQVRSQGDLVTAGDYAYGIQAQSIGGGGGNAAVDDLGDGLGSNSLSFALGRQGGSGGEGGRVAVQLQQGTVQTAGQGATAVIAQSIGGGGGTSSSTSLDVAIAGGSDGTGGSDEAGTTDGSATAATGEADKDQQDKQQALSVGLSLGIAGGTGAAGGEVAVETAAGAVILTQGDDARGILAQSIGGGGGTGGSASSSSSDASVSLNLALGGAGGEGAAGGSVAVRQGGTIETHGDNADGLLAQSVGGGGGVAGSASASSANKQKDDDKDDGKDGGEDQTALAQQDEGQQQDASQITTAVGVNLALGGQGGEGAVGGAVTVANTGSILTWGTDSVGINAQSVGGGGGVGGASSAKDEVSTSNDLTLVMGNIAVSGAGGQGAAGGSVSVDNAGLVQTAGERAYGIGAMSVGGGGGSGGVSAVESSIATGDEGTGSTSLSLSLALGGSGGSGGTGGEVSVRNVAVAAGDAAPVVHTLGDQAYGIYARSIGGGGGDGAMTSSRSSQDGAGTALELGLTLGASGGSGNTGGNVDIVNGGYVLTAGDAAHAVYGQSIGGGGGAAGVTVTGAANTGDGSKTLALALGGSGGSGAAAGEVSITNTGWIGTTGARAYGIFAQSVGGGGGDTALTLASRDAADAQDDDAGDEGGSGKSEGDATESQAGGGAMQLSLALGGSGGEGGRGGAVTVVNRSVDGIADSGVIVTSGDGAHGIFAQSVGGGGGSADLAVANAGSADASAVSLNLALGGNGGSGNAGGDVSVVNDGIIQTSGAAAYGILAQSIGGGGGDGGQSVAIANLDLKGMAGALVSDPQQLFSQSTDLIMAVGGSGGSGGDGGDVSVVNNGRIVTTGDGADGIVAQSIGGGGGNSRLGFLSADGGESGISLYGNLASMLGASGATGGQAGAVSVTNNGSISVSGMGAVAIRTQAINGGGGVLDQHYAGVDLSAAESSSDDDDGTAAKVTSAISTLLGSIGTSDSAGGDVATTSTGDYSASGAFSLGDLTQSIGGGGGSGLIDTSLLEKAGSLSPFSLLSLPVSPLAAAVSQVLVKQIVLGAVEGSGNAGGDIQASHAGTIVVDGDYGVASLQQTIGGGGGNQSDLSQGSGAVVQASLALGATQAGASAGGTLDYRQQGDVVVAGQDAQGLVLQSIGGGGGWANEVFEGGLSGQVDATLGANGGSGLDGGAVSGTIEGTVADLADNSVAVIAQSIGAGGGQVVASGADAVAATLGGRGGAAGDGGAVTLAVQGSVFNAGGNSYGVVAQSIGGGGGFVMASGGATGVAFSDANQGDGGAVDVQVDGSVIGGQAASYGVLAQSLGGGGGWVAGGISGTAGGAGRGGAVAVAIDGDVLQTGDASVAVQAASDGGQGGGDIDVALGGDVRGGSGSGAGVVLEGGADNRILVQGSLSAVSAQAALGGYGNDLLDNLGTLYGNVDLGGGSNRLVNEAGASMVTWDHVALGTGTAVAALAADTGNTLVNHGDLYFGLRAPQFPIDLYAGEVFADTDADLDPTRNLLYGARVISQVALDGNFVQSASGALYMDVAFGTPASDRLAATGSAALAGMGYFTLTSLANADWLPIITAPQGTRDDGFAMENSIALTYKAQYRSDGVYLSYDPAFEQAFLRPNQNALGVHMDSALLTGSSDGIGRLMALLGNLKAGQEGAYRAIFDMINPDGLAAPLYTQVQVQRAFSGSLFGCAGRDTDGASDGASDGACAWGNVGNYNAQRDRTADDLPIALSGSYARFGFDGMLDADWRLSTAFEFDRMSQIQVDAGNTEASSRGVNLGVGFEHEHDGAQTRLTLAGGWSRYASTRLSPVFDADAQAVSHPRTGYLTGSAGLGTVLAHGDWSLRPRVDARYTLLHYDGMREQGLGEIGYRAQAHDQSLFSVVPSVRFAFDHGLRDGAVGLSSTVSYEVSTRDAVNLPLRFIGANDASAPADVQVPVASPYLRWSSRLYYQRDGVSIGLDYLSEHGSRIGGRTYGLDLRVKF